MKRIIALILVFCLALAFSACGGEKPSAQATPEASTNSNVSDSLYTENGVSFDKTVFPDGAVLKVEAVKNDDSRIESLQQSLQNIAVVEAYTLKATADNTEVQPSGKISVSFPLPEQYNTDEHNASLYSIPNSGSAEIVESNIEGIYIKASVPALSTFAVVLTAKSGTGSADGSGTDSGTSSTVSSDTSSTEPQPQPTDIKGKKYHFYKMGDANTCYSITMTFDKNSNKLEFDASIGDDITDNEEMLKECIDYCFKYNNRYYYVGRGDGAEYPITAYEVGKITVSLAEFEGDTGSISYTLDGDCLKIIGVVDDSEYDILAEYLENGDKLMLVK